MGFDSQVRFLPLKNALSLLEELISRGTFLTLVVLNNRVYIDKLKRG